MILKILIEILESSGSSSQKSIITRLKSLVCQPEKLGLYDYESHQIVHFL